MRHLLLALFLSSCSQQQGNVTTKPTNPTNECAMTITTSGTHTLHEDIYADVCGIQILSHNVNLNLNGHTIYGPNNMSKVSYGIKNVYYSNVHIYGGKVTGFLIGVANHGQQADYSDVHDNSISHMTIDKSGRRGIQIGGYRSKTFYNTVINTGGSTAFPNNWNFGIEVIGADCRVYNNTVHNTLPSVNDGGVSPSESVGISLSHFNNLCIVENNVIDNDAPPFNDHFFGFWVEYYSQVTLKNNVVRNTYYPFAGPKFTVLENNIFENYRPYGE